MSQTPLGNHIGMLDFFLKKKFMDRVWILIHPYFGDVVGIKTVGRFRDPGLNANKMAITTLFLVRTYSEIVVIVQNVNAAHSVWFNNWLGCSKASYSNLGPNLDYFHVKKSSRTKQVMRTSIWRHTGRHSL